MIEIKVDSLKCRQSTPNLYAETGNRLFKERIESTFKFVLK